MTARRGVHLGRLARAAGRTSGVAAALALLLMCLTGAAADAGVGRRSNAAQQAVTVELVDQPAWVRPGEPFDVRVQVTGEPADARVDMVVHERLQSRSGFRDTLAGDLGATEQTVPPQPVAGTATGPGGTVSIGFAPGDPGGLSSAGVYPVEVRVLSAGGEVLGTTVTYLSYLFSEDPGFPPLEVAVLVDVAAPPSLQPDGTYVTPVGALARATERIEVLQDTPGVPLTMAPLPETVEGLAQGDPTAVAAVKDLQALAADRPVLARPFVDVDLAALRQADLVSEANNLADGGANVVRRRLGVEPTGGVWLSGPTLGAEAAGLADDLGFDRAVVPPTAVGADPAEDPLVPVAPVRLGEGGPMAMVTDTALTAHLTGTDGVVGAHRFVAELAITWLQEPSVPRAVVVHLPADADIDPEVVSTALGALADGQAVRAVPVEQIFKDVPPRDDGPTSVPLAPHQVVGDLRPAAPAIELARGRVAGVGALLDDPAMSTSLQHSLLLATGVLTPDADRPAYVGRADAALTSVSGAVSLPDEFRITLTSRSSTIPITVTNSSDQTLTVRIRLESDQLEFLDSPVLDDEPEQLVPGTTRFEVPVRARTSGAFTMAVTVTSPEGTIVLDRSSFDVRSTAISGVGIVLSIGAGLFLAVWWARHWHKARRSRALMPPDDPTGERTGAWPAVAAEAAADGEDGAPPEAAADGSYRPAHMARQRSRSG